MEVFLAVFIFGMLGYGMGWLARGLVERERRARHEHPRLEISIGPVSEQPDQERRI